MEQIALPRVVGNKQLLGEDGGGPCEICQEEMQYHEWALLDENGKAIFCSMLTFFVRDHPNVITVDHYNGQESDRYAWGETNDYLRLMASAVAYSRSKVFEEDGPDSVEIFARANYNFNGPKLKSEVIYK